MTLSSDKCIVSGITPNIKDFTRVEKSIKVQDDVLTAS